MTLKETVHFAYSIYLNRFRDFDSIKYNFTVPKSLNKNMQIFFERNKFNLQALTVYDISQLQLRLLINFYIKNNQVVENISDVEYNKYKEQIINYKEEIKLYLGKTNTYNIQSVYKDYIKGIIPFYVFFYIMKYIKFNESFLSYELIKNKLIVTGHLMMFFHHFDEYWVKDYLQDYQKAINLSKI